MKYLQNSSTRSLPPTSVKGRVSVLFLLFLLLNLATLFSLRFGSQPLAFDELLSGTGTGYTIFLYIRWPRTVAALLAGGALATAGVLIQAVLNNSMASPNVIGVNAGAAFFALLAVSLFPGKVPLAPAAFLGALITALFIYGLALRAGLSRSSLILAGIAVSSILNAGVDAISLLFPDESIGSTAFLLGGFSGITIKRVGQAVPFLSVGFLLALFLAAELNILQLGEESAISLGLSVKRTRFLATLAAALLAGSAVSFAGLLGFVGLLVPHMARRLIGRDHRWLIPASALLGASFVLLCDVLSRILFAPYELPVGIVMSLLGGPFFLYLLLRGKRRRVND